MTKCYPNRIRLQPVQRHQVEAQFCGGDITGNGGIALLAAGRKLGLTQALARILSDTRRKASCTHTRLCVPGATAAVAVGSILFIVFRGYLFSGLGWRL